MNQNWLSREAIKDATMNTRELKHCEAEDEVGEEEEEDDDDDVPDTVEIFTFIPWPQWPKVPHAK